MAETNFKTKREGLENLIISLKKERDGISVKITAAESELKGLEGTLKADIKARKAEAIAALEAKFKKEAENLGLFEEPKERKPRKPRTPSAETIMIEKAIVDFIEGNPGSAAANIQAAPGVGKLPATFLGRMISDGLIDYKGDKAARRYFPKAK